MAENRNDYSILEIEGPGYKLEEGECFDSSYYRREYRQAYEVVQTIVNETLNPKGKKTQIQNIVPFIGERGSGKTSAMMSFIRSLEEYSYSDIMNRREDNEEPFFILKNESEEVWQDESNIPDIRFTCVESIDGSLLEKGEDIFKLILAQMYHKFDELESQNPYRERYTERERRELKQKFEKVYRSACRLTNPEKQDLYYEESPITSLKSLSSSMTTKEEFGRLVEMYLEMMGLPQSGTRRERRQPERFLVISVDDLDMNIENGFDMLEKIHRYLMVERVIVVLALDYDQMKTLCERNFFEMVSSSEIKQSYKNQEVYRLARDFLDKVLPASERIYIPNLGKVSDVRMRIPQSKDSRRTDSPDETLMTLKEAVFQEVYEKLRMRMDVEGSKRHFYEQKYLRAFVNFYLMLDRMLPPGKERKDSHKRTDNLTPSAEKRILLFDRNYKILMWDTTNRMLDERLQVSYKQLFNRITDMGMTHSFRNVFYEIQQREFRQDAAGKSEKDEKHETVHVAGYLKNLKQNLAFYGYSYGEVLRIIFCWGRVDNESKEMVRCLLAYYSLEMTRSLYHYWYDNSENRIEEQKNLIDVMNGSFAGSWANKMFPLVQRNERTYSIGARKNVKMREVFQLNVSLDEIPKKEQKIDFTKVRNEDGTICAEVGKLFRTVLTLAMFFEQQYYKAENMLSWKLEESARSVAEKRIKNIPGLTVQHNDLNFYSTDEKANFNIFSFVTNAFTYSITKEQIVSGKQKTGSKKNEKLQKTEYHIRALLKHLYDVVAADKADEEIKEKFLQDLGIDQEFEDWRQYSKGFAIPAYQVDLTYNLMKRVRQREKKQTIRPEELLGEIRETFRYIKRKLAKNDEFYMKNGMKIHRYLSGVTYEGMDISFEDAFAMCPFVKWIMDDTGKYLQKSFSKQFQTMIEALLVVGYSEEAPKEEEQNSVYGYDD